MNKHLHEAIGRMAQVVLGTTTLAVLSMLCVAAHLAANGAATVAQVATSGGVAVACSCCGTKAA